MSRLFNTQSLKIEKGSKTLIIAQKRDGKFVYMNTVIDGKDNDWLVTRTEAEKLYRHLGGLLGKQSQA